MKFNFGTGIAIFYTLFATTLVFVVIQAKQVNYSLVTKAYYEDDLAYQSHYDKIQNVINLEAKVQFVEAWQTQTLELNFPKHQMPTSGEIQFYRPSDAKQDIRIPVEVNTQGKQVIPLKDLPKGLWEVKLDWQHEKTAFYQQENIYIQP